MKYLTVKQVAEKWNISERSVRNYCKNGRIVGAVIKGKHWIIPDDVEKPKRKIRAGKLPNTILERLKLEKESKMPGGIYHKIQIELTYNSNYIEGSRLTHDQTRHIYETNTIGVKDSVINVDDIVETANHFRCIDYIIDMVNYPISESMIKQLHSLLKAGTSDSRKAWFAVGDYKKLENEVGGIKTTKPKDVEKEMRNLLKKYNRKKSKSFEEIIEFHYMFERIHPFQDGNGRVGRLIMFKECLKNNIVPFIIDESLKEFYYRGLNEWKNERGHLLDTCLTAQDRFKLIMDYFGLNYK
mgnify:FL=1